MEAFKWSPGNAYGPVLSQTDLYLLSATLELNPILRGAHPSFHLLFNMSTGAAGGFNPDSRDRDLPFSPKDEPATIPRVSSLIIICDISPWCTVIRNERGVTLGDVCDGLYKEYSQNMITDTEMITLPPRLQEHVKRSAAAHQNGPWAGYTAYVPGMGGMTGGAPARYHRFDWLRDRIFFEQLKKNDAYVEGRLGFKAPNIFVLEMTS